MRIAVLSDIHDHVWNLKAALDWLYPQGGTAQAEALVCCGDLCSPFIARMIVSRASGMPAIVVWGNNDADTARMTALIQDFPAFEIHNELAELVVEDEQLISRRAFEKVHGKGAYLDPRISGLRIAGHHYDNIAVSLAAGGQYGVVFFGHNHQYSQRRLGDTLLLNPGTLMGWNPLKPGENKDVEATFMVFDTAALRPVWYQTQDHRVVPFDLPVL